MPEPGTIRPIDPDAEATRLAEERKRATEAAAIHCRFCGETARRLLKCTAEGWQCLGDVDCPGRARREPGDE